MGKDFMPAPALTEEGLAALFAVDPVNFDRIWPQLVFGVMFALVASSGMRPGEV